MGLAYYIFGWDGYAIVPVALAPTAGHIFSPLLGGNGGKGLATMLGAWIGLTQWVMPVILLIPITIIQLVFKPKEPLWAVLPSVAAGFIWLLGFDWNAVFIVVLVCQLGVILYTHLSDKPDLITNNHSNHQASAV